MVKKSDNNEYLVLEDVRLFYRQKDNSIHMLSTDPDIPSGRFYATLVRGTPIEESARSLLEAQGLISKDLNDSSVIHGHDIIKDFVYDTFTRSSYKPLRVAGSAKTGKTVFHHVLADKLATTNADIHVVTNEFSPSYPALSKKAPVSDVSQLTGKLDPFTLLKNSEGKLRELITNLLESLFQVNSVYTPVGEKRSFDSALALMEEKGTYCFAAFRECLKSQGTDEAGYHLEYIDHLETLPLWNVIYSENDITQTDVLSSSHVFTLTPIANILWDNLEDSKRSNAVEYIISMTLVLSEIAGMQQRSEDPTPLVLIYDVDMYSNATEMLFKSIWSYLIDECIRNEVRLVFTSDIKQTNESFWDEEEEHQEITVLSFRQFDFDYAERYEWKQVLIDLEEGEYSLIDEHDIINIGKIDASFITANSFPK
jgi:hypothetical protein